MSSGICPESSLAVYQALSARAWQARDHWALPKVASPMRTR